MTQPIGGRELDAEGQCDVAGVDPTLRQSGRREGVERELTGDPADASMRIAGPELGAHLLRRVVPPPSYRVATRRAVGIHLRGRRVVDGHGLLLAVTEESVSEVIQFSAGAGRRELVGLREVQKYRADVPAFTARGTFPVVTRKAVDELAELGVLRVERDQKVVHGAKLRGSPSYGFTAILWAR